MWSIFLLLDFRVADALEILGGACAGGGCVECCEDPFECDRLREDFSCVATEMWHCSFFFICGSIYLRSC